MIISDDFKIEDEVSGLRLEVKSGSLLNRLHIESLKKKSRIDRDFWFTKGGKFDGTGSKTIMKGIASEEPPKHKL